MPPTRIICTIGPASSSPEVMHALIRAGMDVARVNFSHGDHATHAQSIATLRRIAEEERRLVAILADLQGPKLRVGEIAGGAIELHEGDLVTLSAHPRPGATGVLPVQVAEFATTDEMMRVMVQAARQEGVVAGGDPVVLTAGIPFGSGGETNMLKVHVVGEGEA